MFGDCELQNAKQPLHVLTDGLLEAVERRLLLGGRLGVRRHQKSVAREIPADQVVG